MKKKKNFFFFILLLIFLLIFLYFKNNNKEEIPIVKTSINEEVSYNSNIIKDVNYSSTDARGNKYTINALQGEIDYSDPSIIYLTKI